MREQVPQLKTLGEMSCEKLYTLSELSLQLLTDVGGEHVKVMVDGRQHDRNVFQRVSDTLGRVFVSHYRLKWPVRSHGSRRLNDGGHDLRS
jgi:hypothetical protein